MKHLGDITKISGYDAPTVDIICGGSPCQDLSVAGKRAGLDGERSGLFMEQVRIVKEMRQKDEEQQRDRRADKYIRPRFMVWENVQGAFSSPGKRNGEDHRGEDFQAVLTEIARIAKSNCPIVPLPKDRKWPHSGCIMGIGDNGQPFSIAYRLHDAQFWGVPQRRKRISLVADFGGCTASDILFERLLAVKQGLSRDIKESRETREGTAGSIERGINKTEPILLESNQNHATVQTNGVSTTLSASMGMGGGYVPMITEKNSYTLKIRGGKDKDSNGKSAGKGALVQTELSGTLGVSQDQTLITKAYSIDQGAGKSSCSILEDKSPTLATTHDGAPAVYNISAYESNAMKSSNPHSGIYEAKTSRTLDLNGGNPGCNQGGSMILENHPNDSRVKIKEDNVVQTLSSRMGTGGGNVPMVMENQTYQKTTGPLCASGYNKLGTQEAMNDMYVVPMAAEPTNKDIAGTLDASYYKGCGERNGTERTVVTYANEAYDKWDESEKGATLRAAGGIYGGGSENLSAGYVVRRLTPLECERLQGFPTVRKVRFTEMTKDEYIAWNINEGHIVVDTGYGKVFATRGPGGIKLDEPKELEGSIVNGYKVVSIRNGDTKMQCRVHRIVWIAEHGIIPDGYVIDHINNDKQDNRLCNLQLLTPAENSKKARADGLYKIHGESGRAKITDEVHDFIQYVYGNTDLSIRQLSNFFGISKSRVCQIIHDDGWTNIGEWIDSKGKKHKDADSPRYKALGNSIALPFWQWMADRMVKVLKEDGVQQPTMASLFDGIGGFPLVYSRCGCKPIWASEVEEYAIAVAKRHFGDDDAGVKGDYESSNNNKGK